MKELRCKDVGFDCQGVIRANSEDDLLKQAAEHARKDHGLTNLDAATIAKIKSKVREA
jgi:predicted small metal-binding protein